MSTALLAPDETQKIAEAQTAVDSTVFLARSLVVETPAQAEIAVELLAKIKARRKVNEDARVRLVKPMKDHAKMIDDEFKIVNAPLDEADKIAREKLLTYEKERQRLAAIEQARLDQERRAAEAAAAAERRRVADEHARAEREAQERERARQAELREAANERMREIAAMSGEDLAFLSANGAGSDVELATAEHAARKRLAEDRERADAARNAAEAATQAQIATASASATVAATQKLASASGSASTSKVWKGVVIDETQVPREYLVVDQRAINAAVRAGVREIPGIEIKQHDQLAVR